MCGIAGYIDFGRSSTPAELGAALVRMTGTLRHRGPDDAGIWADPDSGIALGHTRLSIVDLSPHGHQPMLSPCGRFVLVYNGEIYNHPELRRELEQEGGGHLPWRGYSDTEVVLAAFTSWGVEAALGKFVGMFAFALWDRRERLLYLARDRMGEKPLYFGWLGDAFLFASELKALRAHPDWRGEVDRQALTLFLRYSYVPAPHSIYRGINSLEPGAMLVLPCGDASSVGKVPEPSCYWTARDAAERGALDSFAGSDAEALARLDRLLRQSIAQQMVADVPLGAFLSGGVDSSAIVALMQAQSDRPVRTFTIGFHDAAYNEAEHAREVARHLGTDHTELYVTPQDALEVIPKLPSLYDEPFGDVSQIPTYLVSQLTRQHVTVSLSGDGGDELFGGYNRYLWVRGIWDRIGCLPRGMRSILAGGIQSLSPAVWDKLFGALGPVLPGKLKQRTPGGKLHKLAGVLDADSPLDIYGRLVSQWQEPSSVVLRGEEPPPLWNREGQRPRLDEVTALMMYFDAVSYLPGDILVKVDRASMGVSLESRTPFLDHRLVEYAWQLPLSMKIRGGQGKWLLRQVLYQYVPPQLIERPKAGFAVPLGEWLRGPLREWAEELLHPNRLGSEGFFNPVPIREKWHEHLSGRYDWQYYLWNILMFQSWLEEQ